MPASRRATARWPPRCRRRVSLLTLDLRATGKLAQPNDRIGRAPDHNTAEWSLWLGRPLLGQWIVDVRRLLDAVQAREGRLPGEILVAGVGPAGVVAFGAAATNARITSVATAGCWPVTSPPNRIRASDWASWRRDPAGAGDIAQLAALVAIRRLVIAGGVTGGGQPFDAAALAAAFASTRQVYTVEGVSTASV